MSKNAKILIGVLVTVVLAMVVLTMFNKPPKLPLGPLVGILGGKEVVDAVDSTTTAPPIASDVVTVTDPVTGATINCVPIAGSATPATGAELGAETGTATDPATGAATDPGAGAATATDPTTGAPIAAPADGWTGDARVLAAGGSYDGSRISDTRILAADATVDPATGAPPVDPAAATATATATAEPAATGAATTGTGATGPCPEGTEPEAAGAGAASDLGAGSGAAAGAGTPGSTGATGAAGASTTGAGTTTNAAARSTSDGTNSGNSPEALRAAADATGVMQKAKIQVSTTATLVPGAGGIGRPATIKAYRARVTSAVLVMKLDSAAQQQWTGAGKKVQINLVKSFMKRLGKSYRKAYRSVTVVSSDGTVLAIGDATPGGSAGVVKLF